MRSQQSEWLEVQKGLNAIMFQHDKFSLQYDICRESKKHGAFSNMTHALSYIYKIQWYYRSEIPEVLRALPTWRVCQDHRRSTYPPRKPCLALGRGFRWTKLCLETFFQISNYLWQALQPRFSEREGMWLLQIKYFSSLNFWKSEIKILKNKVSGIFARITSVFVRITGVFVREKNQKKPHSLEIETLETQ